MSNGSPTRAELELEAAEAKANDAQAAFDQALTRYWEARQYRDRCLDEYDAARRRVTHITEEERRGAVAISQAQAERAARDLDKLRADGLRGA